MPCKNSSFACEKWHPCRGFAFPGLEDLKKCEKYEIMHLPLMSGINNAVYDGLPEVNHLCLTWSFMN